MRSANASNGSASASASAKPSALPSAVASAKADAEPSPEPALAEWGKAPLTRIAGAREKGCEAKRVREWIRLLCPATSDFGEPDSIEIVRGRKPNEHYQGENLHVVNHIVTLVQPLRPGADFEARFQWASGAHALDATYPAGADEPTVRFDDAPDDTPPTVAGSAAASGAGSGAAAHDAVADLPPPEHALDDVAGLAAPPTDAEWDAAHEVVLAGSGDLGCETKVVGDWFRARCKDPKHAVTAASFQKGHHKTESAITVADGVATLVTPYVEATETWARFRFGDASYMLVVRWNKGPRPTSAGSFEPLK